MKGLRLIWVAMLGLMGLMPASALASGVASSEDGSTFKPGSDSDESLVLYCGRSKSLIQPLVERFREQSGVEVLVRYGSDAQLVNLLQEEGDNSPADLYWANTTGALGAARENGLLRKLPSVVRNRPAAFVPSSGRWVPLTTRFRVLAYNTDTVEADNLPDSVMDLPEMERFEGRIGWTPTYSSFQDFVTAMRVTQGRETTKAWLQGVKALEPKAYPSNTPMIRALAAGEIDVALTNHYYVLRMLHPGGSDSRSGAPVAMHRFKQGDPGNLALVTGGAVLKTSDRPKVAERFLRFLLSPKSQAFAAEAVNEYPVVEDAELPDRLLPIEKALQLSPEFDFERLSDLNETLKLMREAGLL